MVESKNCWTRLPDDWKPSAYLLQWAIKKRPDLTLPEILDEVENFTEWWTNKKGPTAEKKDWDRTFQTWVRRIKTPYRGPRYQPPSNGGLVV